MKKQQIKFFTDLILFTTFTTVLFAGLMLWLVILSGHSGTHFFLGIRRHDWKYIHFFFSLIFTAAVFLHPYLNFSQISKLVDKIQGTKKIIYAFICFI